EGEAAGYEERLRAGASESGEHALGARRELQALVVHARERSDIEAREQRDAACQALAEVDFAAHRARGNRGDLRFDALQVGDLVDAFDTDQRRVHVHLHQPYAVEALLVRDEAEVETSARAIACDFVGIACARQTKSLRLATRERD